MAVHEGVATGEAIVAASHWEEHEPTSQVIQRKTGLFRALMSSAPHQEFEQVTGMHGIACYEHEARLKAVVSSMPPLVYNSDTGSYDIVAP